MVEEGPIGAQQRQVVALQYQEHPSCSNRVQLIHTHGASVLSFECRHWQHLGLLHLVAVEGCRTMPCKTVLHGVARLCSGAVLFDVQGVALTVAVADAVVLLQGVWWQHQPQHH
jgi:hypothetical protein